MNGFFLLLFKLVLEVSNFTLFKKERVFIAYSFIHRKYLPLIGWFVRMHYVGMHATYISKPRRFILQCVTMTTSVRLGLLVQVDESFQLQVGIICIRDFRKSSISNRTRSLLLRQIHSCVIIQACIQLVPEYHIHLTFYYGFMIVKSSYSSSQEEFLSAMLVVPWIELWDELLQEGWMCCSIK